MTKFRIPDLRTTEKVPGKLASAPFEPFGSFRMYKLQELAWNNNNHSLFNTESGNLYVIFCHEEFDLLKPINIKNDHEGIYKIVFGSERQTIVKELDNKNLSGYYCIFDENFSSLIGNPYYSLPFFSLFKHRHECIINVPADRTERFNLIFDLIYSLSKSSTENKTILIASYLVVILQEANMLYEKFHNGSLPGRKSSAEILTDKFEKLISRYCAEERFVSGYAKRLFITPNHLNKMVKSTTGRTASALIVERILAEAKSLLHQSNMNVSEVAYNLGFEDTSYFTRLFKKKTGITPLKYKYNAM